MKRISHGDRHSTLHYFIPLAMQPSRLWAGTGPMPSDTMAARRDDIHYLGSFRGPMAQSPADADTDKAPTSCDIETAKACGVRSVTVVRDLLR